MADTYTKNISLSLYRYMCQKIVGTENHVKTLRQMNTVRNNIESSKFQTIITSGSFGEGLEMRGSDLDVMFVNKVMEVCEDIKKANNSEVLYAFMETDDVKPGFTQLLVDHIKIPFKYFVEHNGRQYLSSTILKQEHLANTEHVVHGPCVSDTAGIYDHVLCLHCTTWISQASQWITRSSNSWPSYDVKQCILKHGVLFVPIGVKDSPKEDIEWRISFSVAEKFLINTFKHTQLICYALLKILLKDVIATTAECADLLCSYFLKTIIFWISEELPQSIWKPENLIPCFMRCFNRLIYCVDYSVCLHYFIPENNMFEHKIVGRAREILLEKLYTLKSHGWQCMLFSEQLSNFRVSMLIDLIEPHTLHTIEFAKQMNSKLSHLSIITSNVITWNTNTYKRGIQQLLSCYQSSLKYLYTNNLSLCCGQCAQSFPLNNTGSSYKWRYNHYNSCLCFLLQNVYHDAVSGWLMLASFFIKTKEYSKALQVIVYSTSKLTSEKLCRFIDMTDIHHQLFKLKPFPKKSIVQLWKIIFVDIMRFQINSNLIPDELLHVLAPNITETGTFEIPSIVYTYFLNFICHFRLENVSQCRKCIQDLQLIIRENYLIERNSLLQSKANYILNFACDLLHKRLSARK